MAMQPGVARAVVGESQGLYFGLHWAHVRPDLQLEQERGLRRLPGAPTSQPRFRVRASIICTQLPSSVGLEAAGNPLTGK
jgi:hypothetical protein